MSVFNSLPTVSGVSSCYITAPAPWVQQKPLYILPLWLPGNSCLPAAVVQGDGRVLLIPYHLSLQCQILEQITHS